MSRRAVSLLVALTTVVGACTNEDTESAARPTTSTSAPATAAPPPATRTTVAIPTAAPDNPQTLAEQLVLVERLIRDPATPIADVTRAGRLQQLLYRRLGARPEWDATVGAALPPDVKRAYDNNMAPVRFRNQPATGTTRRPAPALDTVPAWTIVDPLPSAELMTYYREAQAATAVAWYWLAAIHLVETRFGRILGTSSAGAQGPMQFLPTTWARCCKGDIANPHDAIIGAATYLVQSGAPANYDKAILTYNPNQQYLVLVRSYAANMRDDERAFLGYLAWQVFFTTSAGDVRLPVGYRADAPLDAKAYLAAHPEDLG
ncbi:MAG: lytic transglycosylase domain-containing protein [Acidimicrobiia bacterium]